MTDRDKPSNATDEDSVGMSEDLRKLEQALSASAADTSAEKSSGPPELVDLAIRNMAERELVNKPWYTLPGQWSSGKLAVLTTAAVVVLTLTVFIQQPQIGPTVVQPESSKEADSTTDPDAVGRLRSTPQPAATEPASSPFALEKKAQASEDQYRERRQIRQATPKELNETLLMEAIMDEEETIPDPASWLTNIQSLKEAGELEAYHQELEAFRQAWPDYPLPPDLGD